MVSDLDILRSAHLIVEQRGEDAAVFAGARVDAMMERGDIDGASVSRRILDAVRELQRLEPGEGAMRH